ncbi:hypothetical protein PIB30_007447 [Stylosanthes scabra]|uniref:Uncharacterized protein n=1 Tax=Stylosanthes scabra TaxID=79078 RepID=A0ABU6R4Z9_9FABA|nr:hypothetical protein [Stylosanthes scabra]
MVRWVKIKHLPPTVTFVYDSTKHAWIVETTTREQLSLETICISSDSESEDNLREDRNVHFEKGRHDHSPTRHTTPMVEYVPYSPVSAPRRTLNHPTQ